MQPIKLFAAMAITLACLAQADVPEPDVADVFYRLDAGSLVPLERQAATFHGSAHGFVVMSMKSAAGFPGAKSPVRFKSGQHVELIVRSQLSASVVDPNTLYSLRKLESKKKTRELVMMSGHASPLGTSSTSNPAEGVLQVDFSKFGTSSLKMDAGVLAPGEYAVGRFYGSAVFCFGVD